jgi:hypothetical protein
MIKINIIIKNIMKDPMVVIGKIIISQIRIIDITSKDRIVLDVIVVKRKVM